MPLSLSNSHEALPFLACHTETLSNFAKFVCIRTVSSSVITLLLIPFIIISFCGMEASLPASTSCYYLLVSVPASDAVSPLPSAFVAASVLTCAFSCSCTPLSALNAFSVFSAVVP